MEGYTNVAALAPMLEALAERCHQAAAMNWLEYFLQAPSVLPKMPYLVLVVRAGVLAERLRAEDVHAAVLMFEYRVLGLRTGVFSTEDASGFRTVIAPKEDRARVAAMAMEALVERGAQIALITYESKAMAAVRPSFRVEGLQWAQRRRSLGTSVRLAESLAATLATVGKATRFNLRYYRRRLAKEVPCEFIADARGLLTDSQVQALNRGSLNPDKEHKFMAQYRACWLSGGFLVGLRSLDGQWLSLIGGWRQGGVTVLHWQMNSSGHERLSIGTAMRSYFLEHEIARGSQTLMFYGGTPHSIQNSFVPSEVTDLFVRRKTLKAMALRVVAKLFAAPRWFLSSPNFIARAICRENLQWHDGAVEAVGGVRTGSSVAQD